MLERPGEGAADPGPLVEAEDGEKVEDGGREPELEPPGGPVEEPGRPGLGRKAMGRITTFPWNYR